MNLLEDEQHSRQIEIVRKNILRALQMSFVSAVLISEFLKHSGLLHEDQSK